MEALDATGSFWFPGSERVAIDGSPVFDPADGTRVWSLMHSRFGEVVPGARPCRAPCDRSHEQRYYSLGGWNPIVGCAGAAIDSRSASTVSRP
jgi:hypothetical protein